ncbi:MAG: RtcB family protein [Deltaproteobacteria bacterium]|nr:RtcB family protein [Deltaproteobacteria bacterium]
MGKKRKKGRGGFAPGPPLAVAKDQVELTVERIDQFRLRIKQAGSRRASALAFLSPSLYSEAEAGNALRQLANVALLPGLVGEALAMPDMHWGYGFPIGGVAAFDLQEGIVSPGGVGYDINCGCRLLATDLEAHQLSGRMEGLVEALFARVPAGVGKSGPLKLSQAELGKVLSKGAEWAIQAGWGEGGDLDHIEDYGRLEGGDPKALSERALERGRPQLGTLGSGNHFLEVGVVAEVFDPKTAEAFGLAEGQLVVQIHSGSRGLGYQVCDDNLKSLTRWAATKGIVLPDRQLVYAPLGSPEAEQYLAGMAAAANYAYTNRQILTHLTRQVFMDHLGLSPSQLRMRLVIDVCHNIAKMESHQVAGQEMTLCVHRKGATRAFAPGRPELPPDYQAVGQPVLIPGDMGRASYVLVGREGAMRETFGSTCHGAGRLLSRQAAKSRAKGRLIDQELAAAGIIVRAVSRASLAEEMPEAYKDVSEVVEVVHGAGLSSKVARLRPLGVVKG